METAMQSDIRGTLVSVAGPVFLADMDHAKARLRLRKYARAESDIIAR